MGLFPVEVAACIAERAMYEEGLHAEEAAAVAGAVAKRREEFAAGRAAARRALAMLGAPAGPIPRTQQRAPAWPPGFIGSITHCPGFCAAVVAVRGNAISLGLDAEAAAHLDRDILPMICTPAETVEFAKLPPPATGNWPKLAFSAKEAFYKCVNPILGEFLDFLDTRVRFGITPARDQGTFELELLRPGVTAPVIGRWAVDAERVCAGACWLPH
jgi:4'-phosphopantetheinyl transferase EntD